MINCGHCKGLHPTVAEVRACSQSEALVPPSLRDPRWFDMRNIEEVERDMQRMEAEADRAEAERDSAAKAAKWDAEARSFPAQMRNDQPADLREMLRWTDELLCTKDIPEADHRWSRAVRALISGQSGRVTEYALRTAIARLETYPNVRAGGSSNGRPESAPRSIERANVPGLYRKDGNLYQVVFNQKQTHLYAKRVTLPPDGVKARPTLDYAPGIIGRLTVEDLVPLEEAEEITRKTGWCVFGHFLTNPVSIKRGMGPKCWAKYGAPAKAAS